MNDVGRPGAVLRTLVSSRPRIVLLVLTAVVGAAAAFGLAVLLPPETRTFAGIAPLTQLVLSVLTPFAAVLLTGDVKLPYQRIDLTTLPARWTAAAIYGVLTGVYGAVVTAAAVSLLLGSATTLAVDPWTGTGAAVLGSLVCQLIPVGVGCAAGLLVARPLRAGLTTIVVPLAVSFVLPRFTPAGTTDWVTPLAAMDHLLPGPMTAVTWAQWLVTAALWVLLPNWLGAHLLRRRAAAATP